MRVLVAGGKGMIGSNVARLLPDAEVRDLKNDCDLRVMRNCKGVAGALVFDLAANTRGIGSCDFMDTARIPLNLLSSYPAHYVYASSSCVYSGVWTNHSTSPPREEEGFDGEPESVNRGYGWAKRVGELACKYSGVPCTIVRPSNIYGPSYDWSNPKKHVIPSLIEKMLAGVPTLEVWGSGKQTRSFMYEEDCARLMIALSPHIGTFNLGGQEIEIGELVTLLAKIIGFTGRIVFDKSKPEGPLRKAQSTQKLESILGKTSLTSLEDGLRRTVHEAQRNYRTIKRAHGA